MNGFSAADMSTAAANGFRDGLAAQPAAAQEAVAWMTHHDEPMLFPTREEAADYCDEDEQPIALYAAPVAAAPVELAITDGDRAVLQRLHDALPTAGVNGWAKGVEVLERVLRMTLASTSAAPGIDLDSMVSVAVRAWGEHQANYRFTTLEGSLRKVCEAVIDASPKGGSTDAKDAARYRWLRDESGNAASDTPTTIVQDNEGGFDFVFGEALDSAIDAAMQATSAEVGS